MDERVAGGLSYEEFRQVAMQMISSISLTRDDFDVITENGRVRTGMSRRLYLTTKCRV